MNRGGEMKKYNFEDIQGQVVVITGSGRGIGKATADVFASQGAKVVISDIEEKVCQDAVEEIKKSGGEAIGISANVTKQEDVANLMQKTVDQWGKIDCLVNNAGIVKDGIFLRMKPQQWQAVMDVNLTGTYLCSWEAVKHMRKVRKGNIINISSVSRFGVAGQANYSSSKAAVAGLCFALSKELPSLGIRVNCVAPGLIKTPLTDALPEAVATQIKSQIAHRAYRQTRRSSQG